MAKTIEKDGESLSGATLVAIDPDTLSVTATGTSDASGDWDISGDYVVPLYVEGGQGYSALPTTSAAGGGGGDFSVESADRPVILADVSSASESSISASLPITYDPQGDGTPDEGWWYAMRLLNASGLQPTISIDVASHFQGAGGNNGLAYAWYGSALDTDDWQQFDNHTKSGTVVTLSNNTAFGSDNIVVSHYPCMPPARITRKVTEWGQSQYCTPPASANSSFVIGTESARTDPYYGVGLPSFDLYGLKITDSGVSASKNIAVLTSGVHTSETLGHHVLEGMVDFLLSADPVANQLRRSFEFYVYPSISQQARYAGYSRSFPDDPTESTNGSWPSGSLEAKQIHRSAWGTDLSAGGLHVVLDHHCYQNDSTGNGNTYYYIQNNTIGNAWLSAIQSYDSGVTNVFFGSTTTITGYLEGQYEAGTFLRLTVEANCLKGTPFSYYAGHGEDQCRALNDLLQNNQFPNGPN